MLKYNIAFLAIHLADIVLSDGLELQIGSLISIPKYEIVPEWYLTKIRKTLSSDLLKDPENEEAVIGISEMTGEIPEGNLFPQSKKKYLYHSNFPYDTDMPGNFFFWF